MASETAEETRKLRQLLERQEQEKKEKEAKQKRYEATQGNKNVGYFLCTIGAIGFGVSGYVFYAFKDATSSIGLFQEIYWGIKWGMPIVMFVCASFIFAGVSSIIKGSKTSNGIKIGKIRIKW